MAGLFEDWQGPDGLVRSCTILTQEAVGRLAAIHDRMPVFLTHDHWSHWLDPSLGEVQSFLDEVLVENRSLIDGGHLLSSYPVSTRVNKPTNDDAALVQPVSPGATHEPMFEA
jgi:putative SOS response-associated peptidase YedK